MSLKSLNHNFIKLTLTRPLEQDREKGATEFQDAFPFDKLCFPSISWSSSSLLSLELLLLLLVAGLEEGAEEGLRLGLEKEDCELSDDGEEGSKYVEYSKVAL